MQHYRFAGLGTRNFESQMEEEPSFSESAFFVDLFPHVCGELINLMTQIRSWSCKGIRSEPAVNSSRCCWLPICSDVSLSPPYKRSDSLPSLRSLSPALIMQYRSLLHAAWTGPNAYSSGFTDWLEQGRLPHLNHERLLLQEYFHRLPSEEENHHFTKP